MNLSFWSARTAIAASGALVATSAFGYWGYGELRALQLREEIESLVEDASARMRASLTTEIPPSATDNPALLRKLYDDAETVDAHVRRVRADDVAPLSDLAGAADDYLLTSREILLRQASSQRYRLKWEGSVRALENHMRADDRSGAWITAAVKAKERVEEDYRDYSRTSDALMRLLASLPVAQHRMLAHLDSSRLMDPMLLDTVRTQVAAGSTRAAQEMERIRQLRGYR
jgi:hypothetical protein